MKQRIVTGAAAAAGFLALLHAGGVWFAALILLMALVGYAEFMRMGGIRLAELPALAGFAGIALLFVPMLVPEAARYALPGAVWFVMLLLMGATVWSKNRISVRTAALAFLAFFYIGIGFSAMVQVRLESGLFWSYLLYACIWMSDIGAYFAGMLFGRHKMWPEISPKKTWEGSVGGVVLAVAAAAVFSFLPQAPESLTLAKAAALGLVLSAAAQTGDLIQSAYKRTFGVKDSGVLLPGHGGILDRTDSWIIAFPLAVMLGLIG